MTRYEGRIGPYRPVTMRGVQIGMADAARFDLHLNFARPRLRSFHLLN
eukprot:CAMPEP_0174945820 /NCGR_PEP_ID=MMETSP1355-20121228/82554_1 /TAXON_ID=464990 /ORGANISM="Hemiselmis tepida, Strain CCMP443" /LENGTH=47 /DNA_ID= /DNA_START= /DNA_END= /DNA_ORIENTATION=